MICERCRHPIRTLGPIVRPHRCKAPKVRSHETLVESVAESYGVGPEYAPTAYGEYYARSPLIYAAIKTRANAMTRPPLKVYREDPDGEPDEVEKSHPLAVLLSKVNPHWTERDLRYGTSVYLDLWGAAYWVLDRAGAGSQPTEIWLYRPDRMRVVADRKRYVKEFVYQSETRDERIEPERVIWFRHFNPLSELAGLSALAPARLSADMAQEGMRHNRNVFRNGILADAGILAEDVITDEQAEDLRDRIKKKFSGTDNSHTPIIMAGIKEITPLTGTPRDMEFMASLRWSLEDVSRCYNVPKVLLQDLERATYENINAAERILWRNTIIPELQFIEARINEMLVPMFGDPALFVSYDLAQIEALHEDATLVAQRQSVLIDRGVLTINEARAELNLEPVPWGDAWWAPWGRGPIQDISDAQQLPAADQGPPGPEGAAWTGTRKLVSLGYSYRRWTPPELTATFKAKVAQSHGRRLDRFTSRFQATQKELFGQQRRDVIRRVRQSKSMSDGTVVIKTLLDEVFSPSAWLAKFAALGRPLLKAALQDAANETISDFGLGISFDLQSEIVSSWLDARLTFWAERTNEETARLLLGELSEAEQLGEGIGDIQARVEKVFDFSDEMRSERIARTEIQSAANEGSIEAYRQSGVVSAKEWLATDDDRTRDDHVEADGQIVPLESPFVVGGELLMQPGDTNGSPENVINCRCTTIPIIGKGARAFTKPVLAPTDHIHTNGKALHIA